MKRKVPPRDYALRPEELPQVPAQKFPPPSYRTWICQVRDCADHGMSRTRLSTTVNEQLPDSARGVRSGITDADLIDEALKALLDRHRSAEVDASYTAYDEHAIDEPDAWGDLASFRQAAAVS